MNLALMGLVLALTSEEIVMLRDDRFESIDGTWDLRIGDEVNSPWQLGRLPGNLPFQGIHHDGVVWFKRTFSVDSDSKIDRLAVRIPMSSNAFELFINGVKIGSRGEIAADGSLLKKEFRNGVFSFSNELLHPQAPNEVAIRFRTFHGNGGVMGPGTILGSESIVRLEHERRSFNASMLLALFLFAGFFHLVLYFGSRNELSYVYFSAISISLGSITAGINTFGYQVHDNPDFNAYLIFVPLLALPYFLTAFFGDFYALTQVRIVKVMAGFAVVALVILLMSTLHNNLYALFERVILPASLFAILTALVWSTWRTIQALVRGHTGAKTVLFGLVSYAVTSALELGWAVQLVPFYVDSYIGFALFIASIVVAISVRFAWLQRQVEMGERDPLTNCLTRRGFLRRIDAVLGGTGHLEKSASVIMVDVDHFKSINDTYGHSAGDKVLSQVASKILHATRQDDVVTRWGGEEFLLVLPSQDTIKAMEIAERVRVSIQTVVLDQDANRQVTASCGVATRKTGEHFEALVSRADIALYEAKHAGRNCVKRFDEMRMA